MFAYLNGVVKEVNPSSIVLDINGVGFNIITPNPYYYQVESRYLVYIYNHIREDVFTLYGFKDKKSHALFLKLLDVKGIGPKTALSILAGDQIDELILAIDSSNVSYLSKFPGIGAKSAGQIILDLKGKLQIEEVSESSSKVLDVVDALSGFGYKQADIKRVLKQIDVSKPVESIIKEALRMLLR